MRSQREVRGVARKCRINMRSRFCATRRAYLSSLSLVLSLFLSSEQAFCINSLWEKKRAVDITCTLSGNVRGWDGEREEEGEGEGMSAGVACIHGYSSRRRRRRRARPSQTRTQKGDGIGGREGRRRQRDRDGEKRAVGSGFCDCFGFDLGSIYRVYAYVPQPSDATLSLERNQPCEHT